MLGNYLGLLNERLDQFFAFDLGSAEMSRSAHLQRTDPNDWLGRKLNLPTPTPPKIMLNNVKISLFLSPRGGENSRNVTQLSSVANDIYLLLDGLSAITRLESFTRGDHRTTR